MKKSRRQFIKTSAVTGIGLAVAPTITFGKIPGPKKLRVGFIGTGARGLAHVRDALSRKDIEVTAICDINPEMLAQAKQYIAKAGQKQAKEYGKNEYDYRNLLDDKNVDAVIISTPWLWHTPMSVDAMKAGKYAGVEVSAAMTLQECWDLVNAHEETGTHLMILENVNYRRDVMAVLNMVKRGLFGELLHFRGGYQHDLREVIFNNGEQRYGGGILFGEKAKSEAQWRTLHSLKKNADLYPTHGLGPLAVYADINRGNRFTSLTSNATKARGIKNYIVKNAGNDHPSAQLDWKLGDIVTSTIETAMGETIILTHDCNVARPYSLGFRVQGVNGITEFDYYNSRVYIDGKSEAHKWDEAQKWFDKYDHPLWKKYENEAKGSGHGGMDYFVLNAFVESAKQNIAPPLDVYDAAAWSAVTPLSERSIENNGMPQDFPDFTRGKWIKRKPFNWLNDKF
ncbi:MAG: glycosyl hydrolase [Bacteroidetes bacterium 4572_117]|nr:MAG: glycosyl hydrolase [Bacteroidetes bacterium 4572_117]